MVKVCDAVEEPVPNTVEKDCVPPFEAVPETTLNVFSLCVTSFVHPVGAAVCIKRTFVPAGVSLVPEEENLLSPKTPNFATSYPYVISRTLITTSTDAAVFEETLIPSPSCKTIF